MLRLVKTLTKGFAISRSPPIGTRIVHILAISSTLQASMNLNG